MSVIQNSAVIGKNEDGSDITEDVDVLVWWRDVGRTRFPRIDVMTRRQFLTIPVTSATAERVFSFAGLTLSDRQPDNCLLTYQETQFGQKF
jgi:hypothetical protein